MRTQSLISIQP